MTTIEDLVVSIGIWGEGKGLITGANEVAEGQADKMLEEATELYRAVYKKDLEEVKDGIGDVFVTLVMVASNHNLSVKKCIQYAYDQISQRKGKTIDGVFVKESDLD